MFHRLHDSTDRQIPQSWKDVALEIHAIERSIIAPFRFARFGNVEAVNAGTKLAPSARQRFVAIGSPLYEKRNERRAKYRVRARGALSSDKLSLEAS